MGRWDTYSWPDIWKLGWRSNLAPPWKKGRRRTMGPHERAGSESRKGTILNGAHNAGEERPLGLRSIEKVPRTQATEGRARHVQPRIGGALVAICLSNLKYGCAR